DGDAGARARTPGERRPRRGPGAAPRPGSCARSAERRALPARGRSGRATVSRGRVRACGPRRGSSPGDRAPAPPVMAARGPIVQPVPVAPPPRLVRLRVTEPEAGVILRALRTTTAGVVEARRLADVLAAEAALLGRAPARPR